MIPESICLLTVIARSVAFTGSKCQRMTSGTRLILSTKSIEGAEWEITVLSAVCRGNGTSHVSYFVCDDFWQFFRIFWNFGVSCNCSLLATGTREVLRLALSICMCVYLCRQITHIYGWIWRKFSGLIDFAPTSEPFSVEQPAQGNSPWTGTNIRPHDRPYI